MSRISSFLASQASHAGRTIAKCEQRMEPALRRTIQNVSKIIDKNPEKIKTGSLIFEGIKLAFNPKFQFNQIRIGLNSAQKFLAEGLSKKGQFLKP